MRKPLQYNARLVRRVDLTDVLAVFQIDPDTLPEKRPWFAAGQYCVLGLNSPGTPPAGSVCRPMSIASPPEVDAPLEFCVRRVARPQSGNPLTHLLWRLKTGDRLFLRTRAAGALTIQHTIGVTDPRTRVLVAAGTGIAPFMSMVRSEVRRNPRVDLSNWALLHGASHPADLAYRQELLALSAANGLKYWATVSRPREASKWSGDTGRVETFFDAARLSDLESRLGLPANGFTPANVVVFVCGGTGTTAAAILRLVSRGFIPCLGELRKASRVRPEVKSSLFVECYDAGSVADTRDPTILGPLGARLTPQVASLA